MNRGIEQNFSQLLEAARRGDEQAAREFSQRYYEFFARLIRWKLLFAAKSRAARRLCKNEPVDSLVDRLAGRFIARLLGVHSTSSTVTIEWRQQEHTESENLDEVEEELWRELPPIYGESESSALCNTVVAFSFSE